MMTFTSILFNIRDILRKSEITKHLKDINNHFVSNNEINSGALNKLLIHAVKNVDYYKEDDSINLNNFPVVNKSIIKANFNSFRSRNYETKDLIKMTTSGSTGTPFTVYQDKIKKARNYADTIYFGRLGGYLLGNKLFYLKIWVKEKMQTSLMFKLQNIVPVDVMSLNESRIKHLLSQFRVNANQKNNVLGYVSALEQLVKYCEKNNITDFGCKFSGVITMSEGLSIESRQKIHDLFNCSVVSRYSNLENGILAQQEIDSPYFLINTSSYVIEIFHLEKDEALEDGLFGRILVTDLYNYAMPMIRYDTGDMGTKIKIEGKYFLKTVEGRKLDLLFDTSGEIISSYIMYKNMWQYIEIEQYQLIQIGEKSYEFKINCSIEFLREAQLIKEFKSYLGQDAEFKVLYVQEIPLLNSGKYRKTVNLYRKN